MDANQKRKMVTDDAGPDAGRITETLDAIPGAWERVQEGLAQGRCGEGTPLDELVDRYSGCLETGGDLRERVEGLREEQ
jgi:hypothetical protein